MRLVSGCHPTLQVGASLGTTARSGPGTTQGAVHVHHPVDPRAGQLRHRLRLAADPHAPPGCTRRPPAIHADRLDPSARVRAVLPSLRHAPSWCGAGRCGLHFLILVSLPSAFHEPRCPLLPAPDHRRAAGLPRSDPVAQGPAVMRHTQPLTADEQRIDLALSKQCRSHAERDLALTRFRMALRARHQRSHQLEQVADLLLRKPR